MWQNCDDPVLSYFCQSVMQRRLPKTKISSEPFSEEEIQTKIRLSEKKYGADIGNLLVEQISRSLLPYNDEQQRINLLQKDGSMTPLELADHHLLASSITKSSTKYILYYPREIS